MLEETYNKLKELSDTMNNSIEGTLEYAKAGIEYDRILFKYGTFREYTEYTKLKGGTTTVREDAEFVYLYKFNLAHRPWIKDLIESKAPFKEIKSSRSHTK